MSPDIPARLKKYTIVETVAKYINSIQSFSVCQKNDAFCIVIEFKFAKSWQKISCKELARSWQKVVVPENS